MKPLVSVVREKSLREKPVFSLFSFSSKVMENSGILHQIRENLSSRQSHRKVRKCHFCMVFVSYSDLKAHHLCFLMYNINTMLNDFCSYISAEKLVSSCSFS